VPLEIPGDLARLLRDDVLQPVNKLAEALLAVESEAHPVELPAPEPGQIEGCLAQRLGRECSRVHGSAADLGSAFHQGDPPAEVGGLRRSFSPAGPEPMTMRSK
jgi:hypothetical protein